MIETDIHFAAELLKKGNIVAIPTETVYGLAGNALNTDAVLKIFQVKKRPTFNPLIVHTNNLERISQLTTSFPVILQKIGEKFWPGPLTILLPKANTIHDLVTAGNSLVAIRIPAHPDTLKLLSMIDFPLCAPSANLSGYISPTTAQHVEKQFGSEIAYILDGGVCQVGIESTIIKLNDKDKVEILRTGKVTPEDISELTGYLPETNPISGKVEAPGMLSSHYAPKTPLLLGNLQELIARNFSIKIGVLGFQKEIKHPKINIQRILSPTGDLNTAAKNLFSYLHELDSVDIDVIIAEPVPEQGIGIAINDRLRRAAV